LEPWDAVLQLDPEPRRLLEGEALDRALAVAADFIDLKSPYMAGHSRRCAELSADAARQLGFSEDGIATIRRAALVHDFGATGVSNSILDKPGPLTRAEFDRVELHPMLTEQMLRRSPGLAALNPVASTHHERCDGSGYHKRLSDASGDLSKGVLAAVEVYVGMTTDRADRDAFPSEEAAAELRRLVAAGALESRSASAVLAAAGHAELEKSSRTKFPGGLSRREIDVLRLAARGMTTQQIADKLFISPKTTDHHIQHIYDKINVSTRAAAALWASQNNIVN
jgi:HD-GYP domain-containing protein (c-di-GMP phosphodiesterase class II)/DNA-binding CsgD family transcriptional regulator